MKVILTNHAKERMVVRKITEKMVKEALANPDNQGVGYQNRFLVFKSFGAGVVKVVCAKEKNSYIVISAIWEKRK